MKQLLSILIIGLLILIGIESSAQQLELTRKAVELFQENQLEEAKSTIDKAIESADENMDPYTWFVHGFIYKELYKTKDGMARNSNYRYAALKSAQRSIELDTEKKFYENNAKAITFIGAKYYNDALDCSKSTEPEIIVKAYDWYDLFVESMEIIEPGKDFTAYEKDIHKQVAESYQNIFLADKSRTEMLEEAIEYYKKALDLDPKDYDSNYNLAINYYNGGVRRISAIDHKTPIQDLMMIQEDCVELFSESLPYMLEAHSQTDKRVEPLKGLMAIYRALSDYEKSSYYQELLEAAVQEN